MPDRIPNLFQNQSKIWNLLGLLSAIIGLVCFALSSTFKHFFGEWDFPKFLLYLLVSLIILCIALNAKRIRVSQGYLLKGHVISFVFFLTSVYSVLHDKAVSGKPDALSTISYVFFALMSLSMSRKFEFGFETGLFMFFLGCFTVQLMKISWIRTLIAFFLSYVLIIFRCYLDSQLEIGPVSPQDHIALVVDHANGEEPPNQDDVSSGNNMVTIENGWMQNLQPPSSSRRYSRFIARRKLRNLILRTFFGVVAAIVRRAIGILATAMD